MAFLLSYLPSPTLRRSRIPFLLAAVLLSLFFFTQYKFSAKWPSPWLRGSLGDPLTTPPSPRRPPPPTLPELEILRLTTDDTTTATTAESRFCTDRFSPEYLYQFRDHSIQYCQGSEIESSRLTCFHTHTRSNGEADSLCIAQGAFLDLATRKFTLECQVREPAPDEAGRGLVSFQGIQGYWYDTGPRHIFDNHFQLIQAAPPPQNGKITTEKRPRFTILVKREGGGHPWHSLMEIWSLTNTLDVLRLSADSYNNNNNNGTAFFEMPEDVVNAQVVILDDYPDGPFFSLWKLLTGRDPVRLAQAVNILVEKGSDAKSQLAAGLEERHNVIVPLAGAANPLWQNDWEDRDCKSAPLLKLFIRRVLYSLKLEPMEPPKTFPSPPASSSSKVKLTFIDRRGSRKLLEHESLLEAARRTFPEVEIRSVDLAALSFLEQVKLVRDETNILVGAHGAGLTHIMFLRGKWEGSYRGPAVVEIQPQEMAYKGFRNLAYMLGHGYFMAKAQTLSEEDLANEALGKQDGIEIDSEDEDLSLSVKRMTLEPRDKWHFADLRISQDKFLEIIGMAVKYVQNTS